MTVNHPGLPVGNKEPRRYHLGLRATLDAGERRRVVVKPEIVAFRTMEIIISRHMNVDSLIVHDMISDGQPDKRHEGMPCSLGNVLARLTPGAVIMRRCEKGNDIGFDLENKSDREVKVDIAMIGEGYKE